MWQIDPVGVDKVGFVFVFYKKCPISLTSLPCHAERVFWISTFFSAAEKKLFSVFFFLILICLFHTVFQ